MRYQSFYPFAQQHSSPFNMGQPGFGPPPQISQPQAPRQPFQGGAMSSNPFGGPAASPEIQSPSRMESYMQTANRFLNTAQQFAPVVQQMAPMMQNLPAMWRLYKGFQSLPSAGASAASSAAATAAQSVARSTVPGPSIPRIFQPPGR
ncbi:VrrA/YqfQ family protein [Sporosarcina limicola]|uniref:YqfQ-like protein n=1 Tax=Sporosarcina limicola TaxID=34101 RepID=A0A927MIE3_9BACL|nr:VrrA/YqfQ family protein [Sporosarcina limicola]MBE1553732.1 hypothetical protein [Sporosarcina limicola]